VASSTVTVSHLVIRHLHVCSKAEHMNYLLHMCPTSRMRRMAPVARGDSINNNNALFCATVLRWTFALSIFIHLELYDKTTGVINDHAEQSDSIVSLK